MAEYIDIVGIKQAVNKGKMQAFVRDGSIYLKCKVSGECVKIGDAPAVDVASVVHGRWEVIKVLGKTALYRCTACKEEMVDRIGRESFHKYCHRCGAKMDGVEEDA